MNQRIKIILSITAAFALIILGAMGAVKNQETSMSCTLVSKQDSKQSRKSITTTCGVFYLKKSSQAEIQYYSLIPGTKYDITHQKFSMDSLYPSAYVINYAN